MRSCLVLASAAIWLGGAVGCVETPELRIIQPAAPPAERDMRLAASEAFVATRANRDEYLIAMPAPHAVAATRDFLVFISVPAGRAHATIDPASESSGRGFVIQAVGLRAGRSKIVSGVVTRGETWIRPGQPRVELNIATADGARIVGVFFPVASEAELNAFARRYAADINDLAPASLPASTAP